MVKNVRPPVPDTTTKTLFDDATLFIFQFWLYDCNVIVYYDVTGRRRHHGRFPRRRRVGRQGLGNAQVRAQPLGQLDRRGVPCSGESICISYMYVDCTTCLHMSYLHAYKKAYIFYHNLLGNFTDEEYLRTVSQRVFLIVFHALVCISYLHLYHT